MFNGSTIEISTDALRRNLEFIRGALGERPLLCNVVKGNAYGHGIGTFVPLAQQLGMDRFAVYSASEAYDLLQVVEGRPTVYIMGDVDDEALEWAVEQGIEFNVFERQRLVQAVQLARAQRQAARVHLEIETGMHRTGFPPEDLAGLLKWTATCTDALQLMGICTHLAGAESMANAFRVQEQKERYRDALRLADASGQDTGLRHVACSAGVLNEPDMLYDMARVGILQYGFWPNRETEVRFRKQHNIPSDPLHRVIRWRSRIMSLTTAQQGNFVGYGTAFFAQEDLRLAVVPVGYAYGYARSLSNSGQVLVRGQLAPVRGIVNMNCITIDVTGIEGVEKGDEVVLIGTQGDRSISVSSFGERSEQLNYELLTRLPHDIPRVVVETHHP
ncbi:MAG: alanine racemase [Flavobacteriales bacterium]